MSKMVPFQEPFAIVDLFGRYAKQFMFKIHLLILEDFVQVTFAHPKFGNILASCSYDRKVIIWKEVGEWIKLFEYSHDSSVNSVAWAPSEFGLILACASSDGTVSILTYNIENNIWETKKIPNAHIIGCNAVSWAPSTLFDPNFDGKNDKSSGSLVKRLATGGCDNTIKIWKDDGDRWVEESRLEVHSDWVRDIAWAPNGLPRAQIASCSQDRRVIIWNSDDLLSWTSTVLHTFADVVWNVSWSITGDILAVSGGDNKVSLWKQNVENQWICINEDSHNQQSTANEARAL